MRVSGTTLERRLQAARPEADEGERRLEAMVASRLFGTANAPPAKIGRFTLLARIGRGAMGDVYAAHDPLLDRKIALKLLRPGAGVDAHERGWLLHEARAAARLAHPNVVAIHDVGELGDDDGGIYVAMEFIAGMTLRAWLRERGSRAQILDVFVHAGRGLAAAHEAGVVHRDFKPENVLICRGDGGRLRVRVVDFGLARVVGHGAPETATGVAGTPAYMAPEQHRRGPVDARADQFSFCVALHEALTGRHPFGADEPGAGGERVLARILAQERPRGDQATPGWLRRVLRRGLMATPSARYASMQDILRELEATPTRRRRRGLLAAGAALALTSSALTVASRDGRAVAPCAAVADELHAVWDEQTRSAAGAAVTGSGLANADEVWERLAPRIDEHAAAWLIARRRSCQARRDDPTDATARLREVCLFRRRAELRGLTSLLVGADEATVLSAASAADQLTPIAVCDDAEGLRREASTDQVVALDVVESFRRDILALEMQVRAGHARAAEPRVPALVDAARERGGPTVLAEALHLRGLVEEARGDHEAAADSLDAAVREAIAARHDRLHAALAVRLVWLHGVQRRRPADARAWIGHAEAAIRAVRDDAVLAARLLDHRGSIASVEDDHATAERLHREAIAVRGGSSQLAQADLAMSTSNLGLALLAQGKHAEAEPQIEAALARYRALFGPSHPTVAAVLSNLGQAHVRAGRVERGLTLLREALALKESSLGREHIALFTTLNNLGGAYSELGRRTEARDSYLRALALGERELGPDSPRLEAVSHNLAFEAWELGAYDEVIRHASRALELQRRLHGASHSIMAPTLELLARGQLGVGRTAEAVATIEEALTAASRGALDPAVHGSLLLSAAWILHHADASPERVLTIAAEAQRLLRPAPGPSSDQARELAALLP